MRQIAHSIAALLAVVSSTITFPARAQETASAPDDIQYMYFNPNSDKPYRVVCDVSNGNTYPVTSVSSFKSDVIPGDYLTTIQKSKKFEIQSPSGIVPEEYDNETATSMGLSPQETANVKRCRTTWDNQSPARSKNHPGKSSGTPKPISLEAVS